MLVDKTVELDPRPLVIFLSSALLILNCRDKLFVCRSPRTAKVSVVAASA